jgi:hypothetical protein
MTLLLRGALLPVVYLVAVPSTRAADVVKPSANAGVLDIPDSPAFEALNVSPTKVLRPTSVKELAFDIASAVGANGAKPGIALELAPLWMFLAGPRTTLEDWQVPGARSYFLAKFPSWFAISAATAGRDHDVVAFSEGVRIVFWDSFDPRFSTELGNCLREALKAANESTAPPSPEEAEKPASSTANVRVPAAAECRRKYVDAMRSQFGIQVAAAVAFVEHTAGSFAGASSGFESISSWLAGSLGWSKDTLFIASSRWTRDVLANTNVFTPAARFRWGGAGRSLSFETSYSLTRISGTNSDNGVTLAGLFEQRLADAVFLELKFGGILGTLEPGTQRLSTVVSVKFDTSSIPILSVGR